MRAESLALKGQLRQPVETDGKEVVRPIQKLAPQACGASPPSLGLAVASRMGDGDGVVHLLFAKSHYRRFHERGEGA